MTVVKPATSTRELERTGRVRLPDPVPDGTETTESLGFVDVLLGDRAVRRAAENTAAEEEAGTDAEPTPPPAETVRVPPPVPEGTESVTKGGQPPQKPR